MYVNRVDAADDAAADGVPMRATVRRTTEAAAAGGAATAAAATTGGATVVAAAKGRSSRARRVAWAARRRWCRWGESPVARASR